VDLVAVMADGGPGFVSTPPISRSSATTTAAGERRRHGWKIRPAVLVNNRRRSAVMLLSSGETISWPVVQSCVTTAATVVSFRRHVVRVEEILTDGCNLEIPGRATYLPLVCISCQPLVPYADDVAVVS